MSDWVRQWLLDRVREEAKRAAENQTVLAIRYAAEALEATANGDSEYATEMCKESAQCGGAAIYWGAISKAGTLEEMLAAADKAKEARDG